MADNRIVFNFFTKQIQLLNNGCLFQSSTAPYLLVLEDGNTVGWYDFNQASTITLSGSTVSRWNDYLGSGHDLIQATESEQPIWSSDGVLFDGVNNSMIATTGNIQQPNIIYAVIKQVTWTLNDRIWCGASNSALLWQAAATPSIRLNDVNVTQTITDSNLAVNTWGIIRVALNGLNSKIIVNKNTPSTPTGNITTFFATNFQLSPLNNSNIQVKELIIRNVADTTEDETTIYNYLRDKYFLNFDYPSVLVDGSTVGWYVADATNSITFSGSTVSRWNDILGSGHDLIQTAGNAMPSGSTEGILFDGIDDYLKTAAFTYNQPEQIYMVIKQVTWTNVDKIIDGNANDYMLIQQAYTTPKIVAFAGTISTENGNLAVNTWGILRVLFNGANSKLQINETDPTTGDFGALNAGGFTLGKRAITAVGYSNIQVKEIILRNVDDSTDNETTIYNYLRDKYILNFDYPSVLVDGSTVGWYMADQTNTLTLTGTTGTTVSRWNDILGSGHDLIQDTFIKTPEWSSSGITFDGIDDWMRGVFTLNQPETVYAVFKQLTWTSSDVLFDGANVNTGYIQQITSSPQLRTYAGAILGNVSLPLNTFGIIRMVLYGADSKIQINSSTAVTGNAGTADMGGVQLGSYGGIAPVVSLGNVQFKEIILRNVADTTENETAIYNYLRNKYYLNFFYPSVLTDGSTVGWYIADAVNTLGLSGSTVSSWSDILGSGHDLIQTKGNAMPSGSTEGILFDGVDDYLKTAAFAYNQPEMIYMVIKQITWNNTKRIFDGYDTDSAGLLQYSTTPGIQVRASTLSPQNDNLAVNTWGILRILFNHDVAGGSKLQVNNTTAITGDFGAVNAGGFTLGAYGVATGGHSNIQVKEIILRNTADSTENETAIYNYLRDKYYLNFSYPSLLLDGSTVGWYLADKTNTITKDGSNYVSRWSDILGSGHDIVQASGTNQPLWSTSGMTFDGIDNFMKTAPFTYNQPAFIYMVVNQITWTTNDRLFDGNTTFIANCYQGGSSPYIRIAAPTSSGLYSCPLNQDTILKCLFNGANSKLQINKLSVWTGDTGTNNIDGFTLASQGGGNGSFSNIQVKEIILRNVADTTENETAIYNYLKDKYSL